MLWTQKLRRFTQATPGFIGMESYADPKTGRVINNYYWSSRSAMELLMKNVEHLKAKELSGKWIAGYQVIIAKIEGAHNDNMSPIHCQRLKCVIKVNNRGQSGVGSLKLTITKRFLARVSNGCPCVEHCFCSA
jgi:heme-degrading monooxygenase HmoA